MLTQAFDFLTVGHPQAHLALLNLLSLITLRGVLCGFKKKTLVSRSPGHQRVEMNMELR